MPQKKAGNDKHDRKYLLEQCGFVLVRNGKGSHTVWEHPELKMMAREKPIMLDKHIGVSGEHQAAWQLVLPHNPGIGTWESIEKHARWAKNKAEEIKDNERVKMKCYLARQFSVAYQNFKNEVKKMYKTGIDKGVIVKFSTENAPKLTSNDRGGL